MATFALSLILMLVVVAIMAVGVIVQRKPIQGTCASLSQLNENGDCVVCGRKAEEKPCPRRNKKNK